MRIGKQALHEVAAFVRRVGEIQNVILFCLFVTFHPDKYVAYLFGTLFVVSLPLAFSRQDMNTSLFIEQICVTI